MSSTSEFLFYMSFYMFIGIVVGCILGAFIATYHHKLTINLYKRCKLSIRIFCFFMIYLPFYIFFFAHDNSILERIKLVFSTWSRYPEYLAHAVYLTWLKQTEGRG